MSADVEAVLQLERVIRALTIRPGDLRFWARVCRKVNKEVAAAHPEYPKLDDMQLMSFVKRLLPEVRARVASYEQQVRKHDASISL